MVRLAEEPLSKITLKIFTADYEYLKGIQGWSSDLRWAIRDYVSNQKRKRRKLSEPDTPHEDSQ